MSYSWLTYLQFRTQLASRLDVTGVFWTDTELKSYTLEALRTWNAAAQFARSRSVFNTAANTAFYDLADTASTGAGASNPPAAMGYTLTDRTLVNDLQYALMEPATSNWAGGWTGTDMFTMSDVQNAVQRARDQFLLETGLVISHSTVSAPSPGSGRLVLSDSIIDLRRVAYLSTTATAYSPLWRTDEWDANAFKVSWQTTPAAPEAYSAYMTPRVALQLIPINSAGGTLDLLTINAGAALDVTTGVLLGVPDDFAWVVKWGAVVDLLAKDAQARDPFRAEYARQRWAEGLMLAKIAGTLQACQISGVTCQPTTVTELDSFKAGWQVATGTVAPTEIATVGRNGLILAPTPLGASGITLDTVINMPVPSADGDFVQIGREQFDAVLLYAVHLASFKMSGQEFAATAPAVTNLMTLAADHNQRLFAQAHNFRSMQAESWKNFTETPMRQELAA